MRNIQVGTVRGFFLELNNNLLNGSLGHYSDSVAVGV